MMVPDRSRRRATAPRLVGLVLALLARACVDLDEAVQSPAVHAARDSVTLPGPPVGVIDSALPIEEQLRRFRTQVGPAPRRLTGGAGSPRSLVTRFLTALTARDTTRLREMALTPEEFAYLVYPSSSYTRPPYRQAPDLVWLQISENGDKGLRRLLRPGVPESLRAAGFHCGEQAVADGGVRLWRGCRVRVIRPAGDTVPAKLFGVIVERDGHYKFVNYDTDL